MINKVKDKEPVIKLLRKLTSLPLWVWILIPVMLALIISIVFSNLTIDALSGNSNKKFSTDNEMQVMFNKKRDAFERLVKMSDEDSKVTWITNEYTEVRGNIRHNELGNDKSIGFSKERWDEYKRLFGEINLNIGLARLGEDGGIYTQGIYLIADSKGMLGGAEKGYVYTTKQIDEKLIVDSVDDSINNIKTKKVTREKYFIFYKKIADNWYIFAEMD